MNFNLRNYYRMIVLIWTNIYFSLAFLDLAFYIFHFDPPIAIYSIRCHSVNPKIFRVARAGACAPVAEAPRVRGPLLLGWVCGPPGG